MRGLLARPTDLVWWRGRRSALVLIAVFLCAPVGATNFALVCGSWDAGTSSFTPYDVGGGSPQAGCPFANIIWVDVDALGFDAFGGLTPAQGAEIAGAVIALWALAWVLRQMRRLFDA